MLSAANKDQPWRSWGANKHLEYAALPINGRYEWASESLRFGLDWPMSVVRWYLKVRVETGGSVGVESSVGTGMVGLREGGPGSGVFSLSWPENTVGRWRGRGWGERRAVTPRSCGEKQGLDGGWRAVCRDSRLETVECRPCSAPKLAGFLL